MANDWYQGRVSRRHGKEHREVRLTLSEEDWRTFDAIARKRELGRSATATHIAASYLALVRERVLAKAEWREQASRADLTGVQR